jgi:NADPH:quinone reductase-like Zn-dependent oxidoreductase/NADP-dependent 3-hydroxy acid dehydrogenase YdfG/acyl carrier protein
VLANEMPKLASRRIDLGPSLSLDSAAAALKAEIDAGSAEREVYLDEGRRSVPRMLAGLPKAKPAAVAPQGPIRLTLAEPGFTDGLRWVGIPETRPAEGEIVIEVKAAGLNFRDVMWALSLIPEEALADGFAGATLGMECGGVVRAVGAGVTGFEPGDRVMAFAPAAFASEVVTRAECVMPLNDGFSFADGATIPVAFLTVLYSLSTLGRLRKGETVLIHGGAGAVGLAAIQYAMHVGARVIATAGSDVKRALLRAAGVEHVLDSRSLRFADEVREITQGKGVDVVLNSLSGDAMRRSLELVKPFGRVLELGKRDFYANSKIGLRPVRHNVSYFAIDADELVSYHPEIVAELLAELRDLFAAGALCPLPRFTLPFSEIDDAFRLMRAAGHVGKIVLIPDAHAELGAAKPKPLAIAPDRTVIVTGGISGFGLATARWLVEACGVRHLALLGRRGEETPGADDARKLLLADGAETVRILACDVSDEMALRRSLKLIRGTMPAIGGVVHAAMVLQDGLVVGLEADAIDRVLAPKLGGALLLDSLTRQDPIELFLMFSSATTFLGSPGQASYVAANAGLEAIARRRQAAGLPGLAVGWGPIADAGYLADQQAARDALTRRLGALPMKAGDSLAVIPAMLASDMPVLALTDVNWSRGRDNLPILTEPMFDAFGGHGGPGEDASDVLDLIEGKQPVEVQAIIQSFMLDEVSTILRVTRDKLDPHRPLPEIGMDSLMAMELRLVLERKLHIEVPTLVLNESLTLAGLAAKVVGMLSGETRSEDTNDILLAQHETMDATHNEAILKAATGGTTAASRTSPKRAKAHSIETVS